MPSGPFQSPTREQETGSSQVNDTANARITIRPKKATALDSALLHTGLQLSQSMLAMPVKSASGIMPAISLFEHTVMRTVAQLLSHSASQT